MNQILNINYQVPTLIDSNNINQLLKHPVIINPINIKSETANKSYNDLFHTFILPIVGDYCHNFVLKSNYLIKGYNDPSIQVDYLGNYIDSITLSLNSRTVPISTIDQLQRIDSITPQNLNTIPLIKLDFLNLPLLVKCVPDANFLITIKFKQTPPLEYRLSYDIMMTENILYSDALQKDYFIITYNSQQPNKISKPIQLAYNKGKLTLC
jgi:hypothetical protein